jgi:hypothetical protein
MDLESEQQTKELYRSLLGGVIHFTAEFTCLDYPFRGFVFEPNLHRFILIRVVLQMHFNPVRKLEYYQSVVNNLAPSDFCIHDLVESRVWPLPFFRCGTSSRVTG